MASHLTTISGPSASARAFAGQQAGAQDATGEPKGLLGLFAALLAGADPQTLVANAPAGQASSGSGQGSTTGLAGLFRVTLQNAIDGELADGSTGDSRDPDALAAAIDGPVLPTIATDPKPMIDFVEALGALKASLDKGEPLDPELLAEVETALAGLADALGLNLDDLSIPDDFAALLETTGSDESGLAGALTQLLAPLAQSLSTAQPTIEGNRAALAPPTDAQLKSLSDKLGALLSALTAGDVPPEKLAALGMTPGQPLDAEIEAALGRFAAGLSQQAAAVPEEPILATPALKVSEPVLAGKFAQSAETPELTATTTSAGQAETSHDQNDTSSQSGSERGRDRVEPATRDTRTPATPATAPVDASNTPAPSAEAGVQATNASRVDAAANPRIIQSGYQTSQQQLNLPQIAFELARQVQDGNTRFQIRLDPPELGRIDVRLDINETGQVNARLVVEKSETLDLMQRDQRGLERALQQAGLDSSKTNLEFSLKQNPFAGQQGQMADGRKAGGQSGSADENNGPAETSEEPVPLVNLYRGALTATGVNITV